MRVNISNNVTKQAIKDACTAYKNFSGVCKSSQDSSQKRDQCRSSIRTTLRYASVIHTLNLKAFLPAGKQIKK